MICPEVKFPRKGGGGGVQVSGVREMWERRGRERGSFARAVGSSQTRIGGLLSLIG